jgi:hypothetical protein
LSFPCTSTLSDFHHPASHPLTLPFPLFIILPLLPLLFSPTSFPHHPTSPPPSPLPSSSLYHHTSPSPPHPFFPHHTTSPSPIPLTSSSPRHRTCPPLHILFLFISS